MLILEYGSAFTVQSALNGTDDLIITRGSFSAAFSGRYTVCSTTSPSADRVSSPLCPVWISFSEIFTAASIVSTDRRSGFTSGTSMSSSMYILSGILSLTSVIFIFENEEFCESGIIFTVSFFFLVSGSSFAFSMLSGSAGAGSGSGSAGFCFSYSSADGEVSFSSPYRSLS